MLLNAFSLNMLPSGGATVTVRPATIAEAQSAAADSAVGHADTAAVFAAVLGVPVATARRTIALQPGDSAVVGQYRGPRLPEGATSLPDGATIGWLVVSVLIAERIRYYADDAAWEDQRVMEYHS